MAPDHKLLTLLRLDQVLTLMKGLLIEHSTYYKKVILTPDKGAVGIQRDFLIDDHPEWANSNNFKGTVIRFSNNWRDVVQYLSLMEP